MYVTPQVCQWLMCQYNCGPLLSWYLSDGQGRIQKIRAPIQIYTGPLLTFLLPEHLPAIYSILAPFSQALS